jgi:hypothetical protein
MKSSIPSTTTPTASDSGIESIKSGSNTKKSGNSNFRARGNSDSTFKKQHNNNNSNAKSAQNKNSARLLKQRSSSLSPTKNINNTPKHTNTASNNHTHNYNNNTYNQHNSPKTAKKMMKQLPPRFSMKKQVSAPVGVASPQRPTSFQPTAINTLSEPTFRNKKNTSTAMTKKFPNNSKNTFNNSGNNDSKKNNNNTNYHNENANLSDSGSERSSKSNKSIKSSKSSSTTTTTTTKRFVRTANFVNAGNPNNQSQRQRNNDSFCGTVFKDEMWAGSAAPPEATALPKPPTDWIKKIKSEAEDEKTNGSKKDAAVFLENKKCSEKINKKASAKTTTKQPPLANSVQQMFASFNPLVSTTA